MHRRLLLLLLLAASCASAPPSPPSPPSPPGVSYRPFEPLPVTPPAAPVEAGRTCLPSSPELFEAENRRQQMTLAAFLAKRGARLLKTAVLPWQQDLKEPGALIRGPSGERWMVIEIVQQCSPKAPWASVDKDGSVAVVYPDPRPKQRREVLLCGPACGGMCGTTPPKTMTVAEVPEGARLVQGGKFVEYPVDVIVDWSARTQCVPVP